MKKIIVLLALVFLCTSLFAQAWKAYPNTTPNSLLTFPQDEGWHTDEPIEWWYTNAHVVGQNSGHEYTIMMTFFRYDTLGLNGFRILNIANETTGKFKTGTAFMLYPVMATDHLEIEGNKFGGTPERWYTKKDSLGNLRPFQYKIESSGSLVGSIDLDYDAFKPPLIVADSGYLNQGVTNYTYYYSQTGMNVSGHLSFDGIDEPVTGIGWIDRQYGNFNPSTGEAYEWFCLQLSNGMDINLWNIFTKEETIPKSPEYRILAMYIDENTSKTISDFKIERPKFAYTSATNNCYANKWHLTSDTMDIDLLITLNNKDSEVLVPFPFLEGGTKIEGTIQGQAVTGKGFAELLHRYTNPEMTFTAPNASWTYTQPITWQLLNVDDGRPITYDLWTSFDEKATFTKIASGLTDTTFLWDADGYSKDSDVRYWFKLVGYSVDSVLMDSIITPESYTLEPVATENPLLAQKMTISPNPAVNSLNISCDCEGQAQLLDLSGQNVLATFSLRKNQVEHLDISKLPVGQYLILGTVEGQVFSKRWVKL